MQLIEDLGVTQSEMYKTFNMGIGLAVVVSRKDLPKVRRFLKEALELRDFEVLTAANGLDALEQLKTQAVDLILLGVHVEGVLTVPRIAVVPSLKRRLREPYWRGRERAI